MSRILILHETDDATKHVARRVADRCRGAGHEVALCDAAAIAAARLDGYDGVVIGCTLRDGHLPETLRRVVTRHRDAWRRIPSAYFSVAGAKGDAAATRQAAKVADATGWRPVLAAAFRGDRPDTTQVSRFTDALLHAVQTVDGRRHERRRATHLLATGAVLGTALAAYAYRQHAQNGLRGHGATAEEQAARYIGDELAPVGATRTTWAMDLEAPPADVWPWLIQLGHRRGGWYAYDLIDNAAQRSAPRVLAEHQTLHEGDPIPVDARSDAGLRVAKMDQDRHLVLTWTPCGRSGTVRAPAAVWSFHLIPKGTHGTRLVVRVIGDGQHPWASATGTLLARQVGPLMQRKQLLGIKMRAERLYRIHRSRARRYGRHLTPP